MAVRCSKCGEELIGAVNRCWKCGQQFAQRPEIDGRPPILGEPRQESIAASQPLAAIVESGELLPGSSGQAEQPAALALPRSQSATALERQRHPNTSDYIDARRTSLTALGGTVSALVLGLFALPLASFRFEAALIALLGLILGIWGLYSPKRGLALMGMLLCCLAIGLGSFTGAKQLAVYYRSRQPVDDGYNPAAQEP